jgi:hypothetical protein
MMKSASNGEDEEIVCALDNCVRVHIIFKSQASRSDSNSFSLSSTVSLTRLSERLRSRVFTEREKKKVVLALLSLVKNLSVLLRKM